MKNIREVWRDIPNYEGCYQVSDMGRVRSLNRWVTYSDGRECFFRGRILDGSVNRKDGYRRFTLSINGKSRAFTASQIVAVVFLGHTPDGHTKVVDHKNGDRSDDRLSNLRIVTHRENTSTTCFRKDRDSLSSKYAGVCWHKNNSKWCAQIVFKDKNIHLGYFNDELKAYQAYQNALAKIEDGTFNPLDYKPKWSSKYKGVDFHKKSNKWRAEIQYKGKQIHLGLYDNELKAYQAYQNALDKINNGVFNPDDYKPKWSSIYKGVSFNKQKNKWRSYVCINGKQKHLGLYPTQLEAYSAIQKFKQKQPLSI